MELAEQEGSTTDTIRIELLREGEEIDSADGIHAMTADVFDEVMQEQRAFIGQRMMIQKPGTRALAQGPTIKDVLVEGDPGERVLFAVVEIDASTDQDVVAMMYGDGEEDDGAGEDGDEGEGKMTMKVTSMVDVASTDYHDALLWVTENMTPARREAMKAFDDADTITETLTHFLHTLIPTIHYLDIDIDVQGGCIYPTIYFGEGEEWRGKIRVDRLPQIYDGFIKLARDSMSDDAAKTTEAWVIWNLNAFDVLR